MDIIQIENEKLIEKLNLTNLSYQNLRQDMDCYENEIDKLYELNEFLFKKCNYTLDDISLEIREVVTKFLKFKDTYPKYIEICDKCHFTDKYIEKCEYWQDMFSQENNNLCLKYDNLLLEKELLYQENLQLKLDNDKLKEQYELSICTKEEPSSKISNLSSIERLQNLNRVHYNQILIQEENIKLNLLLRDLIKK